LLVQLGNCHQQPTPMADGDNSASIEILGGEMAQIFSPDVILAERRLVALQTQVSQPICDIHSRSSGLR
jgi:hypothetical protein